MSSASDTAWADSRSVVTVREMTIAVVGASMAAGAAVGSIDVRLALLPAAMLLGYSQLVGL